MTVNSAPVTWPPTPSPQTVNAGATVTFTAAATATHGYRAVAGERRGGSDFQQYRRRYLGQPHSLTAAASRTTASCSKRSFTDSAGTATTNACGTLTVDTAPTLTTNPTRQTVKRGRQSSRFTAAASGHPAATVQWQVSTDGGQTFTAIAGATSASYSFTAAAGDNGNEYRGRLHQQRGAATSSPATLTVSSALTITTNPTPQTVNAGSTVTLTAAASSNPAATVQWEVSTDGGQTFTAISGATSTTYSFTAAAGNNGYQYEAVFSNSSGTATTNPATLTVNFAPTVTTSPASQTVNAGGTVTLTAAASSNPTATVQWQVNKNDGSGFTNISDGGVYSGSSTGTLTITGATADMNSYVYQAAFTNSVARHSNAAVLTVDFAPTVTTNPTSQVTTAGNTVTFTAAASGNPAATVQWKMSSDSGLTFSDIAGATSADLQLYRRCRR